MRHILIKLIKKNIENFIISLIFQKEKKKIYFLENYHYKNSTCYNI